MEEANNPKPIYNTNTIILKAGISTSDNDSSRTLWKSNPQRKEKELTEQSLRFFWNSAINT